MQNDKYSQPNFVLQVENDRHFKDGSSSIDYIKAFFDCKSKKLNPGWLRENGNLMVHILGKQASIRNALTQLLQYIRSNTPLRVQLFPSESV